MQTASSSTGILFATMLAASGLFASTNHTDNPLGHRATIIYGLSNTKHFKTSAKGPFYVQAGSFKNRNYANTCKERLAKKFHQPIAIKTYGQYDVVIIGPLPSIAEVRALSGYPLASTDGKTKMPAPVGAMPVLKNETEIKSKLIIGDKDGVLPTAPNHIDLTAAIGIANLDAGDGYLGVTGSETDRLVQTSNNSWNTLAAQLGAGYVFYLRNTAPYSDRVQWFTAIEPEINGYYLGQSSIKGDVWRFGSSSFNDMTYNMPIESYRLMFDTALTIVARKQYSLYVIGGIGNAWNRTGYGDAERNGIPCTDQALNLNTVTRSDFAWEAGVGLAYAFHNRISLSLEYLYADLGNIRTPATGSTGTITTPILSPANMKLTSQAALLGLHVAI